MELLKKAPLTEAVCEILFMPSTAFDNTLPGVLFTELKNEFPMKMEKPANLLPVQSIQNNRVIEHIPISISQFFSSDNTEAVQIGKDLLVCNMMAPYKGWTSFKQQILRVLNIYYSNFIEKPAIRRITLRYVNTFVFDANDDYGKIFSFPLPSPPDQTYQKNRAFQTLVEYDTDNGDILSLQFKSVFPPDASKKSVILEINNFLLRPSVMDSTEFENWLDSAHKSVEDLFIASFRKVYFEKLK
ncbi:MAG TPA: TIGR04255 family protein [Mucilaginibacter sp.]|nr:TIGR04255 family protein [Mucilaginibacter sp.]